MEIADTPVLGDSNILLLDTKLSPTAILSNQDTRKQKLNKKSEDLKSIIAILCKEEIGKEMQQVQSELDNKMKDLKLTIEDSITDNHVKLEKIISSTMHNLSVHHHQPNITVSSTLKANQPSPRTSTLKMTTFNFDNTDDIDRKTLRNLPGTIMSYYSATEKLELFPMDDSEFSINKVSNENRIEAIINSLNRQP
jgi:hypothetical protein